jgi:hypothetical protein
MTETMIALIYNHMIPAAEVIRLLNDPTSMNEDSSIGIMTMTTNKYGLDFGISEQF